MIPEKTDEDQATSPLAKHEAESDPSADLPPIQSEPISAILPIYNDLATLQPTLEAWISVLNGLNREYEIMIVDDGSTDGSFHLVQSLVERNQKVRVLRHEVHTGFGACLRTGLAACRFPLTLISTCDGSYQPADLTQFLKWIDSVHLVGGYRAVDGRRYKRNWAERVFHWINRVIFGLRLKDPECRFFLARRSIFARIPIQSSGPFAFAELLAKVNFLGCLMSEVPVAFHPNSETEGKWANATLRQKLTGFRRVFSHPNFGQAILPDK